MKYFNKKHIGKFINILGNILMISSIIFIIIFVKNVDADISILFSRKIIMFIMILSIIVSFGIISLAIAWKINLEIFTDKKINVINIINVYTKSHLARYIPGNVMHYLARNLLGSQYKLSQKSMAVSSIIETVLVVVASFIFILIMSANDLFKIFNIILLEGFINTKTIMLGLFIFTIVIILLIFSFKKRYKKSEYIKQIFVSSKKLFLSMTYISIFCLINALAFIIVIIFYTDQPIGMSLFSMGGFYLIAWFVGLITPSAPGGLGIREYILFLLLTPLLSKEAVLIIVIIMRIITTLADLIAYIIGFVLKKLKDNHR